MAWVTARKDVLFAFFFLAASLAYLSYREKGRGRWYALSLGLFILALLSKAMAVTLPVALLLYDFVKMRAFDRRAVWEKIPFFLLAAAAGAVALHTQDPLGKAVLGSGWSVPIAVGFAAYCLVFYLVQLAWPVRLAAVYSFPRLDSGAPPPVYWLALAALVLAGVWLAWFHGRNRRVVFGALFFAVTYAPVAQLIPFGQPIADRYLYLPVLGPLLRPGGGGAVGGGETSAGTGCGGVRFWRPAWWRRWRRWAGFLSSAARSGGTV